MARRRPEHKTSAADSHLLEQVKLLTEENRQLRALISHQGLNNTWAPKTNTNNEIEHGQSIQVPARSPTPDAPRNNKKGCSCKGSCASKICGCVKKQSACGEFCRCSNAECQNQDPNKENNDGPTRQGGLTKEHEDNIETLSRLNLREKKPAKRETRRNPGLPDKNVEEVGGTRSIFSPDVSENVFDFEGTEIENLSLRFGNDPAETETATNNYESNEMNTAGTERKLRLRNPEKNGQKRGRSKRKFLEVPENKKHVRSMSNEEIVSDNLMKEKNPTKKRSISTGESTAHPKKLESLLRGSRPMTRTRQRARPHIESDESEDETFIDDKKTIEKKYNTTTTVKKELDQNPNHIDKNLGQKSKKKPIKKGKKIDLEEQQNAEAPIGTDDESNGNHSIKKSTTRNKKLVKKGKNNDLIEKGTEDPIDFQLESSSNQPENNSKRNVYKKSGKKQTKNVQIGKQNSTEDPIELDNGSNLGKKTAKKMPVQNRQIDDSIEKENNTEDSTEENEGRDSDSSDNDCEMNFDEKSEKNENNIESIDEPSNSENPVESGSSDYSDHEMHVQSENEESSASTSQTSYDHSDHSVTSPPSTSMLSDKRPKDNTLDPEANEEFNPMIPRRQLSRSPAAPSNKSRINQPLDMTTRKVHDPSEIPLPVPCETTPEIETPPPEELSQAVVDWDEHKRGLVNCRKCNRTFYPHRIKKHEANCKKT